MFDLTARGRAALQRTARWVWRAALTTVACLACAAHAGVLDRAALEQRFPAPYIVGEREADPPVWPIFKPNGPTTDLVAYVFESIDLAPIPGFSGTPLNLLIALTPKGEFMDVRVLSHHEPVFLDGLGEEPLFKFVAQYPSLTIKQNIRIGAAQAGQAGVAIDGVAKATASVRIVNQTVLASALKVARAKLGYAGATDPALVAKVRDDLYEPKSWQALEREGTIQRVRITEREVEAAFAGTPGAGLDAQALAAPDATYVEFTIALLSLPSVGRNVLDDAGWRSLRNRTEPGDHVLLVMAHGRDSFVGDEFVRGAAPARLSLKQNGLPIEMRDLDLDATLALPPDVPRGVWKAFRVIAQSGLDPAKPITVSMLVTRSKGQLYPERTTREIGTTLHVPDKYWIASGDDQKGWRTIWTSRAGALAVLIVALTGLAVLLARQSSWVVDARRLAWFRPAFLVFTLVFVGWIAQGQLSIVNLVALLQAVIAKRDLTFFLYDPMSLVLWAFVLVTLVVWGRGTFCGWLCPYGALQELIALGARLVRVPQVRLRASTDRALKRVKYAALALVTVAAVVSPRYSDAMVEIEPFKTAITLVFVRSWPFVLYAAGLVALGAVINKFFCRYLCPLGAALALMGRLRRVDWIARRIECGQPCQTCRHRCTYQAIAPQGRIDYQECFQCMDCVSVHASDTLCAPRILERKGRPAIRVHLVEETLDA